MAKKELDPAFVEKRLNELKESIDNGTFSAPLNQQFWGGAEVIVDTARRKNVGRRGDVYIVSKNAAVISALFEQLRDTLAPYLDYLNKYEFYPRIGAVAKSYIEFEGDDIGVLKDMISEAIMFFEEEKLCRCSDEC